MGVSNLKVGLRRKLSSWMGERIALEREIVKIVKEYGSLEDKRMRVERLGSLIRASNEIMAELEPGWTSDDAKPSIPRDQKLPYDPGMVIRWAFAEMRRAARPISSKDLAVLVIKSRDDDVTDQDLVDRVRAAIDASLRGKEGKYVRVVQVRPTLWEIISEPQEA